MPSVEQLKKFFLGSATTLAVIFLSLAFKPVGDMAQSASRVPPPQISAIYYLVLGVLLGLANVYSWMALTEAILIGYLTEPSPQLVREKTNKILEFISFKTLVILLVVLTLFAVPGALWPLVIGFSSLLLLGVFLSVLFSLMGRRPR
jgi:hypothetical protein